MKIFRISITLLLSFIFLLSCNPFLKKPDKNQILGDLIGLSICNNTGTITFSSLADFDDFEIINKIDHGNIIEYYIYINYKDKKLLGNGLEKLSDRIEAKVVYKKEKSLWSILSITADVKFSERPSNRGGFSAVSIGLSESMPYKLCESKDELTKSETNPPISTANSYTSLLNKKPSAIKQKCNSIDLYDLINLFTPDLSLNYNLLKWTQCANDSRINWLSDGLESENDEYYRQGESIVEINNKIMECLGQKSAQCKWLIILHGPRGGYTSFNIESVNSQEISEMTITELFKSRVFKYRLITQDYDSKSYIVTFPNKKPLIMKISWSCGSDGCSLSIECNSVLNKMV